MIMVPQPGTEGWSSWRGQRLALSRLLAGWPTMQLLSTWSALFLPGRIAGKERYARSTLAS